MKTGSVTLACALSFFAVFPSFAQSLDLSPCEALYGARPEASALRGAVACYGAFAADRVSALAADARLSFHERQLLALTAAITSRARPSDGELRGWINQGLDVSARMMAEFGDGAAAPYWRASMITFDKALADGLPLATGEEPGFRAVPPVNMLGAMGAIQELMHRAQRAGRDYHGYGPLRIEGVMQLMLPEVFFPGSAQRAQLLLADAYRGAPRFSMNAVFFAKALAKNGRRPEAIHVLERLIAAGEDLASLGEDRIPESRADIETARRLLREYR